MKLFFETSAQATVFLLMLPLGMLFAACVDLCTYTGIFRPIWDLMAVLLCFVAIGLSIVLLNDDLLRMYHLLSVLVGSLLYLCGIRRFFKGLQRRWKISKKDGFTSRKNKEQVE